MPMAAPRPCSKPGCRALTRGGAPRCELHAVEQVEVRAKKQVNPGYLTTRWRRLRAEVLAATPVCQCGAPAGVVDHVVPHRGNEDLMWSRSNLQACCKRCHDRKSAASDGWLGNPVRSPC